jgi:uncharacterized protein
LTSPLPGTGDSPLAELEAFLGSERAPEGCMQISDLDGFLTAVAIGPEPIRSAEWLGVIWGDGRPDFESAEEEARIVGAILARYREIVHLLRHQPEAYAPIFWETADGEVEASDWAAGFMEGVRLRPQAWAPLLDSDDDRPLIGAIAAVLDDAEGKPLIAAEGERLVEVRRKATDLLPLCVLAIDEFWGGRRPRARPEVANDASCPCGSGRSYIRCCGAH